MRGRSPGDSTSGGDKNVLRSELKESMMSGSRGVKGINDLLGGEGGLLDNPINNMHKTLRRGSNWGSRKGVSTKPSCKRAGQEDLRGNPVRHRSKTQDGRGGSTKDTII